MQGVTDELLHKALKEYAAIGVWLLKYPNDDDQQLPLSVEFIDDTATQAQAMETN